MPEILLIGERGQIAWELQVALAALGNLTVLGSHQLDLANRDRIVEKVRQIRPQIIVNAAAYTAVDRAESESELCMSINAQAPSILAELAHQSQALLVHYSTDYVFDGTKIGAYLETDPTAPLSVYGASKLAGERAIVEIGCPHLILRTTWVYGNRGKNFLLTILRLATEQPQLKIVADQIGAPTWSRTIALATAQILAQCRHDRSSIQELYHLSAGGQTSWHGFATEIVDRSRALYPERQLAVESILGIPTIEYPTPAQRPANSVLDNSKLANDFGIILPDWDTSLSQLLARW